jgi:hypothetical protein
MPDNNRSDLGALLSGLLENKNLKRKFEVYAEKLLKKRTKNAYARHITPSDIISSITLKLLDGDITWNCEVVTLTCFFYRRIRSEVFNLASREKKFIPVPLDQSENINDYEGDVDDDISLPPQFIIYPFGENEKEDEIDPVKFEKIAYELFKDSEEEFCVLDEMFKGNKPNLIAANLGISENDVYNTKKRILRVLKTRVRRNNIKQINTSDLPLINNNTPCLNPQFENKPGTSTPENNNNGELS